MAGRTKANPEQAQEDLMSNLLKPLTLAVLASLSCVATAAATACTGNVVIGDIDSQVTDRAIHGTCITGLLHAEPNVWGSHHEFVDSVEEKTEHWNHARLISRKERAELLSAAARSDIGKTLLVKIAAINDFHGQLQSPGNSFGKPVGGIDYLAAYVDAIRAKSPNSVVVSAGDLIGGTPLMSALFHDEPTIEAMNLLGLEINAVGNHEFDEGKDELLRMQHGGCHPTDPNSCQGNVVGTPYPFEGARFKFLAANVHEKSDGKTLFAPYTIKNFKGNKVAFIGVTLEGTPSIVTPSGISTLDFKDEADTVNALVPKLRRHGVQNIVVLLHEGGADTTGADYKDCTGVSGAILDIVARLHDEVDMVISGHTHQSYLCSLPNSVGRNIPVTSTNAQGRMVTEVDMVIDTARRDVASISVDNVLVDRSAAGITPVAELTTLVANYAALSAPLANQAIGQITATITRANNAGGESALGDVIADAQLVATAPADLGGAVIAFMNPGGIRADFTYPGSAAGEGDGVVTYGEAFTVQPFGNSLVTKTLTGQQIYDLLEQQWAGIQPYARILQVSQGFGYQHSFDTAAVFNDVKGGTYVCDGSVTLNGVAIDKAGSYRVTMNSFLATGGDNFTVFNLGTDQLGGAVDLDAMTAYFQAHTPTAPGAQDRIVKVSACPAP
jgi:5'-nucleotidase